MSEPNKERFAQIRTTQQPLFVETLEEAIEATAAACGGKKLFAIALRPELEEEPERAHRWLLDALNPDRRTEFHATHLIRACRIAAKYECHVLKRWFDEATGYAPEKTPQQKLAERRLALANELKLLADKEAELEREEAARQLRNVSSIK